MKGFDLNNLDFNNAGAFPVPVKAFFCAIVVVVIGFLTWYLFVDDQQLELEGLERKEAELKIQFEEKQGRAANLQALKDQLAEMELMLQQMLKQLPSKTEMPDIIVDISQAALSTGIQSDLFKPGRESKREFYAEKPIELRMEGTYHQFGAFVSGVASLPRVVIMTMHDIELKPKAGTVLGSGALILQGTVKTYRYLDDDETQPNAGGR